MVEETIEVEAQGGLDRRPRRRPDRDGDRRAGAGPAATATNVVTGDAGDLEALAAELRGQPLIGHDLKGLGGAAGTGLLAAARPEGLDLAHDTMVAAYLIDPARRTYDLHELAADAGLAAAPAGAEDGQLSLAAEEGDVAGDPAVDARLVSELARASASGSTSSGVERASQRGRDAADRGPRRDGARSACASTRARSPRSAPAWRSRSTSSRPRSTSSPATSSRSARRSSSRGLLRRAGADQEAPRQDRLLDRRSRARPAPRRAPDRRQGRALARADQAQEHLSRLAADARRRRTAASTRPSTR